MSHARFARITALDTADAEELFAATLEVGFDGFDVGRGHDEDHADAHIERLQQFIGLDFPQISKKLEDARDRPGGEINLRFYSGRQDTRQVAGDASTGDVRESGNPPARDDIFERRGIAQMGL